MVLILEGTQYKPLSSQQTQPAMTAHDIACAHTMVGNLTSTHGMFMENGYGGTESHVGVGGKWGPDADKGLDGVAYQWQDMRYSADANLDGSRRIISVETADNAPHDAADIQDWTQKQLDKLIEMFTRICSLDFHKNCPEHWVCRQGVVWNGVKVAIPPVLVPDSKPSRRGLAYHRQGINPWRVSGGEKWSKYDGKECPADRRIKQFKEIVIPAVQANIKGNTVDMEEQDMAQDTFIAWHSNVPYWCEPGGKRQLTPDNARWLKDTVGIKDVGAATASFLNELPTYDEAGTAGGSTVTQLLAADDSPAV
jgi:hypothetical protein